MTTRLAGLTSRRDTRVLAALAVVPLLLLVTVTATVTGVLVDRTGPPRVSSASLGSLASLRATPTTTVLPALSTDAPLPTTGGLRRALTPALDPAALGPRVAVSVMDAKTGTVLLGVAPETPMVPASTTKLVTGAAALTALGPQTTLATRVLRGASDTDLVLVGGGDVLLGAEAGDPAEVVGRAGLADLAVGTATTLKKQGVTAVTLAFDDSLFSGPAVNPAWNPHDVGDGFVAPIMAMEVNEGRIGSGDSRQPDPAMFTATTFARRLADQGITVRGPVSRTRATGTTTIAEVRSATIGELVEYTLIHSDNTVAEVLARLVAVQRELPATFAGAGKAILAQVKELGVPMDGATFLGGSGLAPGNAVSPQSLARLLVLAAGPDHPGLSWLFSGLPVAGASGTLALRFDGREQARARGMVRAKTGTLTGVNSLAGVVVDADGRLLVFAFMADRTTSWAKATSSLDSAAAVLAGCGCRS